MNAVQTDFNLVYPDTFLPVMLDGVLLGSVDPKLAPHMVNSLRLLKVRQNLADEHWVPMTLEIAYLPPGRQSKAPKSQAQAGEDPDHKEKNYLFPGIFFSSQIARFVRPV